MKYKLYKKGDYIDVDMAEEGFPFVKVIFEYKEFYSRGEKGWYLSSEPSDELQKRIDTSLHYIEENAKRMRRYAREAAKDIVSKLSEDDINHLRNHPEYIRYHRTFGLQIRNNYIYGKIKDFDIKDADSYGHYIYDEVIKLITV